MFKKKEIKRSLVLIGKQKYDFDIELEEMIYRYLCCKHIKKRILKKMDNKYKFESYKQWKKYIHNKYARYSLDELVEFSKYLNLKIRNIKPFHQYWNLILPIVITISFSHLFEFHIKTYAEFSDNLLAIIAFFFLSYCLELLY